jgi:hypothetical protein
MAKVGFSTLFNAEQAVLSGFTFQNEAMAAALVKAKEAKQQKLAETAANLFGAVDAQNNSLLDSLRKIRKQEKAAKALLDNFKGAVEYFLESGNFGPLYPFMPMEVVRICQTLGVDPPTEEEQKVPTKTK